jgi:PAS domain S-box-containing protein
MSATTETHFPGGSSWLQNLIEVPEHADLLRLTKLVEHLFHVPVAYMAFLGADLKVVTRVGSGSQYWEYLKTYPPDTALANPVLWPDPGGDGVDRDGVDPLNCGDLRFIVSVPLRSGDGLDLGMLVIGDVQPRPGFSGQDHETLAELAAVLAGKMELRIMAAQAREAELLVTEAERRFRQIANAAPVLIVCSSADGANSFVNKAWTEFTGRSVEDELGERFEEVFHPDHRQAVMQTYWEAFDGRKPLSMQFPMRRHDGEYRWMHARGMPRFLSDGKYAGHIGCLFDITDERRALLDLRKQKLCTAAVADAAGVSYLILDAEGRTEDGQFTWQATERDAICQAISSHAKSSSAQWAFTPVLSAQGELLAITATTGGVKH